MQITHFDQQGDVRLIVQKDGESLGYVVNSVILRLASPVFAALVGPHFREGNRLRTQAAGIGPIDIELLEDKPQPLEILLNILHMREVPEKRTTDELIQLAALVEKYQCARACSAQAESWMSKVFRFEHPWQDDFAEYLGLGVIFQSTNIYARAAIGLALSSHRARSHRFPASRLNLTKRFERLTFERVISNAMRRNTGSLCDKFGTEIRRFAIQASTTLSSKVMRSRGTNENHSEEHFCRHDEQVLALYHGSLAHHGLLSPSKKSPVELLYRLCLTVQRVCANAPAQDDTWCTACTFVAELKPNTFEFVKDFFKIKEGPEVEGLRGRRGEDKFVDIMEDMRFLVGERLLDEGDGDSTQWYLEDVLLEFEVLPNLDLSF